MSLKTELVVGRRGSGKTTKLIQLAGKEWYYIVCLNKQRADYVATQARELMIDIPYPISFNEFQRGHFSVKNIKGFLIDDVDDLFQFFSRGVPVVAMSFTEEEPNDNLFSEEFQENHFNFSRESDRSIPKTFRRTTR